MSALNEYYATLERLKVNKPKGSAINNDMVALEAGRKRGSIKKSRHAALVEAIGQNAQQAGQMFFHPHSRLSRRKTVPKLQRRTMNNFRTTMKNCWKSATHCW